MKAIDKYSFLSTNAEKSHPAFCARWEEQLYGNQWFQHQSLDDGNHLLDTLAVPFPMPVQNDGKQSVNTEQDDLRSAFLVFQQRTVEGIHIPLDAMVSAAFQ